MVKLRPHHGLCTAFFCGHGYSAAFTRNLAEKIAWFHRENPEITLTVGEDCICACCPHNQSHVCDTAEQVRRYDTTVLHCCGLLPGQKMTWQAFCDAVHTHIFDRALLPEICGDCKWYSICGSSEPMF